MDKLLGLSLEQLENTEGMALEMVQPCTTYMYSPAMPIVLLSQGFVYQDAINICLLPKKVSPGLVGRFWLVKEDSYPLLNGRLIQVS